MTLPKLSGTSQNPSLEIPKNLLISMFMLPFSSLYQCCWYVGTYLENLKLKDTECWLVGKVREAIVRKNRMLVGFEPTTLYSVDRRLKGEFMVWARSWFDFLFQWIVTYSVVMLVTVPVQRMRNRGFETIQNLFFFHHAISQFVH